MGELKLAGFVDIEIRDAVKVSREDIAKMIEAWQVKEPNQKEDILRALDGQLHIVEIIAKKPAYETGASVSLKLGSKNAISGKDKKSVWTFSTENDELEDEDELLDEDDLIKPDKNTLVRKYNVTDQLDVTKVFYLGLC